MAGGKAAAGSSLPLGVCMSKGPMQDAFTYRLPYLWFLKEPSIAYSAVSFRC